jgi:hypothetical protein
VADRCLYFGCWNTAGHYLVGPGGSRSGLPNAEAYELNHVDGQFAPKRDRLGNLCWEAQVTEQEDRSRYWQLRSAEELPQGQFLRHRRGKWSLIQWWDRNQGDTRGACNSTILLEGEHTSEEVLAAGRVNFPHVFERLAVAGVELVEVHCG